MDQWYERVRGTKKMMERVGNNNNENNKNLSSVIKLNEKKQKEEEQCGLMDFSYSLKIPRKKGAKKNWLKLHNSRWCLSLGAVWLFQ